MLDAADVGMWVLDTRSGGASQTTGTRGPESPGPHPGWWLLVEGEAHLRPDCLEGLVGAVNLEPTAAVTAVYSDFFVTGAGTSGQGDRMLVGGWSRERARWQDYCGSVALVRADVLEEVSAHPGRRHRALLAAGRRGTVVHLPVPLYGVPSDPLRMTPADDRAIDLQEAAVTYTLTAGQSPRMMESWPSVSVVIPTRGSAEGRRGGGDRLIDRCLESLLATAGGLDPEVVLVVDDDSDQTYIGAWRERLGERLVVVGYTPPFNFPDKLARGVAASSGEVLVFLNDDVEALGPGWLNEMVALASEGDVGAVGALLLYPDGTVQHAGHRYGDGGVHLVDVGALPSSGPRLRNEVDRDVTGVTAACLVQRRSVWDELGGMDLELPISFNDVEYCHRIVASGYRVVQCNSARLRHAESKTRRAGAEPWEVERLRSRIGAETLADEDPLTPCTATEGPPGPWAVVAYRLRRARQLFASGGLRALAGEVGRRRNA